MMHTAHGLFIAQAILSKATPKMFSRCFYLIFSTVNVSDNVWLRHAAGTHSKGIQEIIPPDVQTV